MNTPRLRTRNPTLTRRQNLAPVRGLPPHPFRYALVATLGVGVGMAILGGIGALGTVQVQRHRPSPLPRTAPPDVRGRRTPT